MHEGWIAHYAMRGNLFHYMIAPGMVSVDKLIAALPVRKFARNAKTRRHLVCMTHSAGKAHPQMLRKCLALYAANVNVAVETRTAFIIRLDNNFLIGLFGLGHGLTPIAE